MPGFTLISQARLATCHLDLQRLFNEVIKTYDCSVICGHRGEADQEAAVEAGTSKTHWPHGKHNKTPSEAVDAMPCPIDWQDKERNYHFAGFVKGVAQGMGIKIRWGGDFNGDGNLHNDKLVDSPHFEIVE